MRIINNKHGWLRIFEAFVSVLLIMGVLLILLNKSSITQGNSDEILNLQKNILSSVDKDPVMRSQILVNDTSGVKNYVKGIIPVGLNYSVQICEPLAACPLNVSNDIIINNDLYASTILIVSNNTFYNERQLKLFFWRIS